MPSYPDLPDDLFPDDLPDGVDPATFDEAALDAALADELPAEWLAEAKRIHAPSDAQVTAAVAAIAAAVAPPSRVGPDVSARVLPFGRRPVVRAVFALAATLLIGVAIGRATRGAAGLPRPSRSGGAQLAAAPTDSTAPSPVARAATQEHLARTEALLTVVRAATARGEAPSDLGPWARDLLTTTRLFLDSPIARDPREQALLEELELLLVAVVQASASQRSADTELLAQQLRRRNVLPRLRALTSPMADAAVVPISE